MQRKISSVVLYLRIGNTESRRLETRMREHMDGYEKGDKNSPFSENNDLLHRDEHFQTGVKIIAKCFGKPSRGMIIEAVLK